MYLYYDIPVEYQDRERQMPNPTPEWNTTKYKFRLWTFGVEKWVSFEICQESKLNEWRHYSFNSRPYTVIRCYVAVPSFKTQVSKPGWKLGFSVNRRRKSFLCSCLTSSTFNNYVYLPVTGQFRHRLIHKLDVLLTFETFGEFLLMVMIRDMLHVFLNIRTKFLKRIIRNLYKSIIC